MTRCTLDAVTPCRAAVLRMLWPAFSDFKMPSSLQATLRLPKPTARAKTAEVLALKGEGVGATEIAKRLEIGRASVYRILASQEAA